MVSSPEGTAETVGDSSHPSDARLEALLSSLDDLVFELDGDGAYLGVWAANAELLAAPRSELFGKSVRDILPEELASSLIEGIRRALETGVPEVLDYSLEVPAGLRWFQARMARIGGPGAHSVCLLVRDVTAQNIAERAREVAETMLRHQAQHDALTGLPNRFLFHERLDQMLSTRRRGRGGFAIVMLDLDHFKEINDTLGHLAGDSVLIQVAVRLTAATRDGDLVARLGGDEFAVLLPGAAGQDVATTIARLSSCLEEPIEVDGVRLEVDLSAGVAVFPVDGRDADSLLRRADTAMYAAKALKAGVDPGASGRPPT